MSSRDESANRLLPQDPPNPLTPTSPTFTQTTPPSPPRTLTTRNGLSLVLGLQIGSGIFSSPSVVILLLSSPLLSILAWFLAGLLVFTGASSFIELGTRVPKNGGIQEYLRYCYGDLYGFLGSWIWILVSRPCAMAMVSLVFAEYLGKALWQEQELGGLWLKGVGFCALWGITWLNCLGTSFGTGAASFFLVLKLVGLGSVVVVGVALMIVRPESTNSQIVAPGVVGSLVDRSIWSALGSFTDAILAALFAYGGWESIGFVAGEITEPQFTLPSILNRSMVVVVTLFTLANATFYYTLPLETFQKTNAVAIAFGIAVFGKIGAIFYAWIVCLSCLGALNSIVFSTGRQTQAAGARQYLPAFLKSNAGLVSQSPDIRVVPTGFLGRIWQARNRVQVQNIPVNSMVLNAAAASIYVVIGSFRGLLSFKGMVEYMIYFLTISGLLFLHYRPQTTNSDSEHRNQIYLIRIFNPVIFCCVAGLIVVRSAIAHVFQAVIIVLLVGGSTLVYHSRWWRKLVSPGPVGSDVE